METTQTDRQFPQYPYYAWDAWYVAARSAQLKAGGVLQTTIMEQRLIIVRSMDGELHALQDRCLHLGSSLASGKLEGRCLVCPFHGWKYGPDGKLVDVPALGAPEQTPGGLALRSYHVREGGGLIWVFMSHKPGTLPETDPIPEELLEGGWQPYVLEDCWPVNYTRFVENMMDQIHVAWVHRATIGRKSDRRGPFEPTIVERPDGFDLQNGMLEFRFPVTHRLLISPVLRQRMYSTPVGPSETRIFIMGLRKFARMSWLDPLFNFANRRILNEDRGVVLSQIPDHITYGAGGDLLLKPDTASKAYRKMLAERLAQQG